MQIVDMSSIVSQKRCLQFPGKSCHSMQNGYNGKNVSNQLHGSHKTSDKLPGVYQAMRQTEQTHQTVEAQEDKIIKT